MQPVFTLWKKGHIDADISTEYCTSKGYSRVLFSVRNTTITDEVEL